VHFRFFYSCFAIFCFAIFLRLQHIVLWMKWINWMCQQWRFSCCSRTTGERLLHCSRKPDAPPPQRQSQQISFIIYYWWSLTVAWQSCRVFMSRGHRVSLSVIVNRDKTLPVKFAATHQKRKTKNINFRVTNGTGLNKITASSNTTGIIGDWCKDLFLRWAVACRPICCVIWAKSARVVCSR